MGSISSLLMLAVVVHLGFALLAISEDVHWRNVGVAAPLSGKAAFFVRFIGGGLIALALLVALWREGPGFGSLLWMCGLSIAALSVVTMLSWRVLWLRPLARVLARCIPH